MNRRVLNWDAAVYNKRPRVRHRTRFERGDRFLIGEKGRLYDRLLVLHGRRASDVSCSRVRKIDAHLCNRLDCFGGVAVGRGDSAAFAAPRRGTAWLCVEHTHSWSDTRAVDLSCG